MNKILRFTLVTLALPFALVSAAPHDLPKDESFIGETPELNIEKIPENACKIIARPHQYETPCSIDVVGNDGKVAAKIVHRTVDISNIIQDNKTKLLWSHDGSAGGTYEEAKKGCEEKGDLDKKWRLATKQEAKSFFTGRSELKHALGAYIVYWSSTKASNGEMFRYGADGTTFPDDPKLGSGGMCVADP